MRIKNICKENIPQKIQCGVNVLTGSISLNDISRKFKIALIPPHNGQRSAEELTDY